LIIKKEGIYQFIWGLLKKVVIADTCATYANAIFDHYESMNVSLLWEPCILLSRFMVIFRVLGYGIGMSKLFGIDLFEILIIHISQRYC
jgi:D-alanyl-lipoteichoic acid acyltransferase DltB (MBOAT superfamily)